MRRSTPRQKTLRYTRLAFLALCLAILFFLGQKYRKANYNAPVLSLKINEICLNNPGTEVKQGLTYQSYIELYNPTGETHFPGRTVPLYRYRRQCPASGGGNRASRLLLYLCPVRRRTRTGRQSFCAAQSFRRPHSNAYLGENRRFGHTKDRTGPAGRFCFTARQSHTRHCLCPHRRWRRRICSAASLAGRFQPDCCRPFS